MPTIKTTDRIGVFIASAAGVRPAAADYDPYTQAVSWSVVAGSGLWQAELQSNLGSQNRRIRDKAVTVGGNRQVEIWKLDDDGNQERLLFWGELLGMSATISGQGEEETLVAAMKPYHFGQPVSGQKVSYSGDEYTLPIPLEFQPQIDGKIIDNRFKPTGHTDDSYFWIDPESTRTDSAKTYQDGTVDAWTVGTALESLLLHFNASETFVANDTHDAIGSVFASAPVVKNLVLAFGDYLPAYLDAICHRFGFGWVIDCKEITDTGSTHYPESFPAIRFFKQQEGTEKTVKMQAPGEVIDLDFTNSYGLQLQSDLGELANIVRGYGALIEREFTIPLYRTWEDTDDGNEDHEKPYKPIGRKWAANEAGDYNGIRAEIPDDPPDFGTGWIPKRRVIEDCLTLREDQTHRRPAFLEYREDSVSDWKPIPNEWGYRVLQDEIGVWFTGQREEGGTTGGIPEQVLTTDVELRITGTIRGDKRVEFTTVTSDYTPNSNEITQTIDLSDRYFDRKRETGGTYASVLVGAADEKDDLAALTTYINDIRSKSDLADVQATCHLIGLHYCWDADGNPESYCIGDIITKVEGREISFNRAAEGYDTKYLQVVGIKWINEQGNQSTILQLSPTGVS